MYILLRETYTVPNSCCPTPTAKLHENKARMKISGNTVTLLLLKGCALIGDIYSCCIKNLTTPLVCIIYMWCTCRWCNRACNPQTFLHTQKFGSSLPKSLLRYLQPVSKAEGISDPHGGLLKNTSSVSIASAVSRQLQLNKDSLWARRDGSTTMVTRWNGSHECSNLFPCSNLAIFLL